VTFGARASIRLGALRHNLKLIRDLEPRARIMAVIKANAYGHGLLPVAKALADADSLAVARLEEAVAVRQGGVKLPLVLLGGVYSEDELAIARRHDLEIVVHCGHQLRLLEEADDGNVIVWLKIDSGMRRLGFLESEVKDAMARLGRCAAVRELRCMTHLACADDRASGMTERQFRLFSELAGDFDGDLSIGNSPGVLGWSGNIDAMISSGRAGRFWIRPGIALYGVSPFPDGCGADYGLQSVMQFESRLIAAKVLAPGDRVGYGGKWQAERATTLGIVSAGYGDGYSRFLRSGTPVLINGRQVPVAGNISMDSAAVDLGPEATDKVGDPVLLWGEGLPVEDIARHARTIPYQLVCGVMHREPAQFID